MKKPKSMKKEIESKSTEKSIKKPKSMNKEIESKSMEK
jgi:hypothetical protein